MRLSLCNVVIRELPFAGQCELAAKLGYDGLELAPFTLGPEPHLLEGAARAELRRAATAAGITITSLHWLLLAPAGLSITSADDAVRRRTVEVMRRLVELCAEFGGTALVHGSPRQRELPPGDETEARKRALDCLRAAAEAAERAGVTYCLEPLAPTETNFVTSVEQAVAIVEQIDSPAFRTMIDACAAGRSEMLPVAELIDRWLPTGLVAHIHLNDRNRRAPGQGEDRFAPILAALRRHGYAGVAAVEPFVYEPDGATAAARAIGYLRGILEALP
ncbi:MAG TPA: sugar phosphate isomerase/epimerase family protein [Geminicoccaceae bacterium]|nr:sugar phosphate isomerase/epimerase family protein [Geminicoccaceae bacterium]